MLDDLLGYALSALEGDEAQAVAAALGTDPELRAQFLILTQSLLVLEQNREFLEPPIDLALRTRLLIRQTRD